MGIRPNRTPQHWRCRHTATQPEPVILHDRLDGRPEIVAWLCPDCYEETHGPPPPPPGIAAVRASGISVAELNARFLTTGDQGPS